jgi:chemotaxis protein CheZ
MPAGKLAPEIVDKLEDLRDRAPNDPHLAEVLKLAEDLVKAMQGFFTEIDRTTSNEFRYIAKYIVKARDEIAALRPKDMSENKIPSAGAELEAIVRNTEEATNTIMTAAETIMGADTSDAAAYQAAVNDEVMKIFEACSFQDLTGQRVSKVVTTLKHIEERITAIAAAIEIEDADVIEAPEEKRARELLLNGPALNGPEVAQGDIDAMFDTPTAANQDDIDAMFGSGAATDTVNQDDIDNLFK